MIQPMRRGPGRVQRERRDAGLCVDCGAPAIESGKLTVEDALRIARADTDEDEIRTIVGNPRWSSGDPLPTFKRLSTTSYCARCTQRRAAAEAQRQADRRERARAAEKTRAASRRATAAKQELRAKRRAASLCVACGKNPPSPDHVTCSPCRAAMGAYNRRRQTRDKDIARCLDAGEAVEDIAAVTRSTVKTVRQIMLIGADQPAAMRRQRRREQYKRLA